MYPCTLLFFLDLFSFDMPYKQNSLCNASLTQFNKPPAPLKVLTGGIPKRYQIENAKSE